VPGGVGEDAPPVVVRLELRLGCAQFQDQSFGLVEVVDREVEVELLRHHALGWPGRCLVVVGSLEADEEPVLAGEPGEIVARVRVELEAGGLMVERGQCPGVGAVERDRRQLHVQGHRQLRRGMVPGFRLRSVVL
jgi:hypothetical protein